MKRAKQAGINLFEAAELAELVSTFPPASDLAACAAFYRERIAEYHAAMLAGDTAAALAVVDTSSKLVTHLHDAHPEVKDARGYRKCWMDWSRELEVATAAAPGEVPLWGQAGSFVLTAHGVPVRIELEGMCGLMHGHSLLPHFSINVVEPLRMFFSETGYRSCFSHLTIAEAGMTLETAILTYIGNYFRSEMKGKLVALKQRYVDQFLGRPKRDHYDDENRPLPATPDDDEELEDDEDDADDADSCPDCGLSWDECECIETEEGSSYEAHSTAA